MNARILQGLNLWPHEGTPKFYPQNHIKILLALSYRGIVGTPSKRV